MLTGLLYERADGSASVTWVDGSITAIRRVPCGGWVIGPTMPVQQLTEQTRYQLLQEPVSQVPSDEEPEYASSKSKLKRRTRRKGLVVHDTSEPPEPRRFPLAKDTPLPYNVAPKARPTDEKRVKLSDMLAWSIRVTGANDPSVMFEFLEFWTRPTAIKYRDKFCHCGGCLAGRIGRVGNHDQRKTLRRANRHAQGTI